MNSRGYPLLFLFLSVVIAGCELLIPPPEPPCIILGASFERLYPEERHRVRVRIRTREEPLPETISLRFEILALRPAPGGDERDQEELGKRLLATRAVEPLDERTGLIELIFNSPFFFMPQDPMTLSGLTLLSLGRKGETMWSGELTYPYVLEEALSEPE